MTKNDFLAIKAEYRESVQAFNDRNKDNQTLTVANITYYLTNNEPIKFHSKINKKYNFNADLFGKLISDYVVKVILTSYSRYSLIPVDKIEYIDFRLSNEMECEQPKVENNMSEVNKIVEENKLR